MTQHDPVHPDKLKHLSVWLVAAVVIVLTLAAGSVAAGALAQESSPDTCVIDVGCSGPPIAPPLGPPNMYESSDLGFRLDGRSTCFRAAPTTGPHSILWDGSIRSGFDDWWMFVAGQNAGTDSAEGLVQAVQARVFPGATHQYDIPGAQIGYEPGAGAVYDYAVTSGSGDTERGRAIVMVAIKDGVAIKLVSLGPFERNLQKTFGHSNPAQTWMAFCSSEATNSVTWQGEEPR